MRIVRPWPPCTSPVWLDFPDHQYLSPEQRPTPVQVAPELRRAVTAAGASVVFLPMGLANPDHVLTHDAGLRPGRPWRRTAAG